MAKRYGSNRGSSSSLAEQHEAAKAIPRALPVDKNEEAQGTDSGEEGHPQFIGRAPDGSPVLRLPSGEIATVARPVESNELRRRHYKSVRVELETSTIPQTAIPTPAIDCCRRAFEFRALVGRFIETSLRSRRSWCRCRESKRSGR
jgi:hypothetical protein